MEWMVRGILALEKMIILLTLAMAAGAFFYFRQPLPVLQAPAMTKGAPARAPQDGQDEDVSPKAAAPDPASARDLFVQALAPADLGGTDAAGAGALPPNLKVVGMIVGAPSQVVIEDTAARQTYMINAAARAHGIEVVAVHPDEAVIRYQGREIRLPMGSGK